ncbi:membrane protein [Shewanella colwelliana]|uniref:Membrane protein n=1 Tax=Shewanella colwelliana TaxID=23 RepID=A0ABQ4PAK6_SHECO|nr:PH domain-containing protein [Shewanella colwelliana]GIU18469.1 membrane protein [Shewanella colwelliana]GIU44569.1 membrane protein [Shewanella colwelliana]
MEDKQLLQAEFKTNLGLYWLVSGAILLCITIVGIPLLLIWFPVGLWATKRYIDNMSAELTTKKLIVRKGIFTRTENTVPLDKITDMALIQGPLMRFFNIHKLTIETAGQSGAGALINLQGVEDVEQFRAQVLAQKSALTEQVVQESMPMPDETLMCLKEISETLKRIENRLATKS